MEDYGYRWARTAGTSVGALIAALITAGYTAKEMKRIMINTNFQKFKDRNGVRGIPLIGKPLGVIVDNSIYSGDYVEKWVEDLLESKGIRKFSDISKDGVSPLKIIASDVTRRCMVVLPDDLPKYGMNPMEFPIAKAIRMSISIPFYFRPIRIRHGDSVCFIVDGSVCCNYPINIFDVAGSPRWPTIGFKFKGRSQSYTASGRTDTLSLLFDIADTMNQGKTNLFELDENKARSIVIPTVGVESTDFDISREKSHALYKFGYRSAMEFLKTWDFEEYIRRYRVKECNS